MFLHWNQIRSSLEQWKQVLHPEPTSASLLNYTLEIRIDVSIIQNTMQKVEAKDVLQ